VGGRKLSLLEIATAFTTVSEINNGHSTNIQISHLIITIQIVLQITHLCVQCMLVNW